MLNLLKHFFYMGGYGGYVFTAYGIVMIYLSWQWLVPWRRLKLSQRKQYE